MIIKQFLITVTIAFVFFGVGSAKEDCFWKDVITETIKNNIDCTQIYGEGQFEHKFVDSRLLTQSSLSNLFDKINYNPGPDTVMLGYNTIKSRYYLIKDIPYYYVIEDPDINTTNNYMCLTYNYLHSMEDKDNSLYSTYSTEDKENFCRNLDSIDKTVNGVNNNKFNQCRYLFDIGALNYNNLSKFPKKVILCQENITVNYAYRCWHV